MRRKLFVLLALLLLLTACFAACSEGGSNGGKTVYELSYSDGVNDEGNYDNTMFYRNDLMFDDAADPGVIYEDGYYYAFCTGAPIRCYRTKNFANWELVGHAFTPDVENSWAYGNFWAPEVIKSKADGKFYMYYTASTKGNIEGVANPGFYTDRLKLSVAVSDRVEGPYVECKDAEGNFIVFDIANSEYGKNALKDKTAKVWAALDAHPFYDGDQLYLYFAKSRDVNFDGNDIYVMKMNSMTEPDYNTIKRLTRAGYSSPLENGVALPFEENCDINEAPNMLKHTTVKNGEEITKYYLTYSMYGYNDRRYAVGVAVSDSPMGDFVKLDAKYNQPVHGIDVSFDHMSGTGHHQFIENGEDFFIIYHAHKDRAEGGTRRALAADRMVWTYNEELGYDILHSNGPTYSLQPVPYEGGAYKNVMKDATITVDNIKEGSADLLKDGVVTIHSYDSDKDLLLKKSGATVTIEFKEAKNISAIMVYNSYESYLAFSKIRDIKLENESAVYVADEAIFPEEYYLEDKSAMRPGGAVVLRFEEISVNKITFTVKDKIYKENDADYDAIALSEIVVLGK